MDDVVLDVQAQAIDLGHHPEVLGRGQRIPVDRDLQGGQLGLQVARQLVDLGLRAIQGILGEIDSRAIRVAVVDLLRPEKIPAGSKIDLTIATVSPVLRSFNSWL